MPAPPVEAKCRFIRLGGSRYRGPDCPVAPEDGTGACPVGSENRTGVENGCDFRILELLNYLKLAYRTMILYYTLFIGIPFNLDKDMFSHIGGHFQSIFLKTVFGQEC